MAEVTATALVVNTPSANLVMSGGTAFTDATTHTVAYPREGKLLLIFNSTYASAGTIVIAAGDFIASGQGTITITTAQNGVYYLVVSSDRVKDSSGDITITYGTSNTGFTRALSFPY